MQLHVHLLQLRLRLIFEHYFSKQQYGIMKRAGKDEFCTQGNNNPEVKPNPGVAASSRPFKNTYFNMKSIRYIVWGIFITLGLFSAVMYSSCSKNECGAVTCLNKGTCSRGLCQCPGAQKGGGVDGPNCEIVYRNIYNHQYRGITRVDTPAVNPNPTDSTNFLDFLVDNRDTNNYTTMFINWEDTGSIIMQLPIKLSNFSTSGATFSGDTTYGIGNINYSGTGSVNGTMASMELKKTDPGGNITIYHFYNFVRR
jgi:hypothetical protein